MGSDWEFRSSWWRRPSSLGFPRRPLPNRDGEGGFIGGAERLPRCRNGEGGSSEPRTNVFHQTGLGVELVVAALSSRSARKVQLVHVRAATIPSSERPKRGWSGRSEGAAAQPRTRSGAPEEPRRAALLHPLALREPRSRHERSGERRAGVRGQVASLWLNDQERVRKYWTMTAAIAPPKVQATKGHALVPSVTWLNQCWAFMAAT